MTTITATPPASFDLRDEAKALATSVAITVGFTVLYVALAPIVLLGAVMGGPLWAIVMLTGERG